MFEEKGDLVKKMIFFRLRENPDAAFLQEFRVEEIRVMLFLEIEHVGSRELIPIVRGEPLALLHSMTDRAEQNNATPVEKARLIDYVRPLDREGQVIPGRLPPGSACPADRWKLVADIIIDFLVLVLLRFPFSEPRHIPPTLTQ